MNSNKNEILDIIITLVNGIKTKGYIETEDGLILWNPNYLVNQIIRQYSQPNKNYYISEKAKELWHKLTSNDIMDKYSSDKVILDKLEEPIVLNCYKGASSYGNKKTFNKNDKLTYNDVFHDDHIIPIKLIIQELKNLPILNYETVKETLGKIRICKMLKEEDRSIKHKTKRSTDFKKAIEENYKPQGIKCINIVTGEII